MSALSRAIGARIKRIRKQRKLTQVQLSQRTGITQAALSRAETGEDLANISTVRAICRATKTSLARFFFAFPVTNEKGK